MEKLYLYLFALSAVLFPIFPGLGQAVNNVGLHIYTVSQKKQDTKLLAITSLTIMRFLNFFQQPTWQ